ncbi:MAG: Ig-like domain-containing domain, partial [Planctomycetota bacterium]
DAPLTDSYAVVVSPNSDFSGPVVQQAGINDSDFAIAPGTFEPKTDYYWKVTASNMAGSTECQQPFSFRTAGPVRVVSTDPADGEGAETTTTVRVVFDEPMDTVSVESAFAMTDGTNPVNGSFIWLAGDKEAIFAPDAPLLFNVTYEVTITDAALDTAGNALDVDADGTAGGDYSFSFTTTEWWGGGTPGGLTVSISTTPAIDPAKPFTDDSTLDTVTVTVGGGTAPYTVTLTGAGAKTQASPVTFTDVPLVEGENTLLATATDENGDFGQATLTVILDTTPPEVEVLTPHRIASGHLRDSLGRPVLVAGSDDIERVYDTDPDLAHRTKRNVIGVGTQWRIRTDEDLAPISAARVLSFRATDADDRPPMPPTAWEYLNMSLEAHPSAGAPPDETGNTTDLPSEPGTHTASPLSGLDDGEYWIVVEVENEAGGVARVGGLVYVDQTAPLAERDPSDAEKFDPQYSALAFDADTIEVEVDGDSSNMWGNVYRATPEEPSCWIAFPDLDFEEGEGPLRVPAPKTASCVVTDYAGNETTENIKIEMVDSHNGIRNTFWGARYYGSDPEAQEYFFGYPGNWDRPDEWDWIKFPDVHDEEQQIGTRTYRAGRGSLRVRVDGVTAPSGAGVMPAPPVWPASDDEARDVTITLAGEWLGIEDLDTLTDLYISPLLVGSHGDADRARMEIAPSASWITPPDGVGLRELPGDETALDFPGTWGGYGRWDSEDSPGSGDMPAHWWNVGWQPVSAQVVSYLADEMVSIRYGPTGTYDSTTGHSRWHAHEGLLNIAHVGPSTMVAGSTVTVRVVGGGFDTEHASSGMVWLYHEGALVAESVAEGNPRVVEFDLANSRRYRAFEVDVDLPDDAPIGVYDVEVKIGDIAIASHDDGTVGSEWAGPHGGLVVGKAVNILKIDFLSPERDDSGVWTGNFQSTELLMGTDPQPRFENVSVGELAIAGGTATFHLEADVLDDVADIAQGNDIASYDIEVNGQTTATDCPIQAVEEPDTPIRPYAFRGHISTDISFSLSPGLNSIVLRTEENGIEKRGSLEISFLVSSPESFGRLQIAASPVNAVLTGPCTADVDTLVSYLGERAPTAEDAALVDTVEEPNHFVYWDEDSGTLIEMTLVASSPIDGALGTERDFLAVSYSNSALALYGQPMILLETAADSLRFRSAGPTYPYADTSMIDPPLNIHLPAIPHDDTSDSITIYRGLRDPEATDAQLPETSQGSSTFSGVLPDLGAISVTYLHATETTGYVDQLLVRVECPALGMSNDLLIMAETGLDRRVFRTMYEQGGVPVP